MDLHNLNDMLDQISGLSVTTEEGQYVSVDDLRRLIIQRELSEAEEPEVPPLRTWDEARYAAKEYLRSMQGPDPIRMGRSIPASPSAVEGVNR
jgi:hypothetical protein